MLFVHEDCISYRTHFLNTVLRNQILSRGGEERGGLKSFLNTVRNQILSRGGEIGEGGG